ncbi:(2Fe-2S)-binding protein [Amycolatopsis sp. CA-128772]|uniref:(2Fe-2S)-binding protein n=1 Tax=Amycolatopsis sp. CA-128772 TaxID=2073159 RepID=UPI000CD2327C|nr:(2Fe-2S)-binding protein [Amycolatopsis sp. CA-128772]
MSQADVNGVPRELPDDGRSLVTWLRELGLTGTKSPCGSGHCGGCTVLLDERPVLSCIVLAATTRGRRITTIEGLAEREDELLEQFAEHSAAQCGFCTPGMIVAARAHLSQPHEPSDERQAARRALAGNVCRCTGYTRIVDAVLSCESAEEGAPCAK